MGSRSKFHKSELATTRGRFLIHAGATRAKDPKFKDPRTTPQPKAVKFTGAFWDELRDLRTKAAAGKQRVFAVSIAEPRVPRAVRRAEAFMAARQAPRAQRQQALQTAREAAVLA